MPAPSALECLGLHLGVLTGFYMWLGMGACCVCGCGCGDGGGGERRGSIGRCARKADRTPATLLHTLRPCSQGDGNFENLGFCTETPVGGVFNIFETLENSGEWQERMGEAGKAPTPAPVAMAQRQGALRVPNAAGGPQPLAYFPLTSEEGLESLLLPRYSGKALGVSLVPDAVFNQTIYCSEVGRVAAGSGGLWCGEGARGVVCVREQSLQGWPRGGAWVNCH